MDFYRRRVMMLKKNQKTHPSVVPERVLKKSGKNNKLKEVILDMMIDDENKDFGCSETDTIKTVNDENKDFGYNETDRCSFNSIILVPDDICNEEAEYVII
jgi:hypothetical protein